MSSIIPSINIFKKEPTKKLRILFVAAEVAPFIKVGGLGEVMHSLPNALRALGHDARVFLPKYATIDTQKFPLRPEVQGIKSLTDDSDPHDLLVSNVLRYEENGQTIAYFLENMEYYEKRANVYGYVDDTTRWVLLSKGVLEFIKVSKWKPDIIVASDWQTGFVPNLLRTDYKNDPVLSKIKVIFCIHNLQFQGLFDHHFVSEMDYDAGRAPIPAFFDPNILKLNGMRRGIMYADLINTVSPTYAKEILNDEFGEKLDDLLKERRSSLFGILNGIDVESFNPQIDSDIVVKYSVKNLDNRSKNKIALQKRFNLALDKNKFIAGIISRMDAQKGFDLIVEISDALMRNIDFQLIILGTGSNYYRGFFQDLQKKYPDRIGCHFFFDNQLPKLILAGADTILVPSRFEPCGLVQMEAMRYGAIPIVRKTGGLADSVENYIPGQDKGTGFIFENYDRYAFLIAFIRASETFRDKKEWIKLMKRAMSKDFSWKKSAEEYTNLFLRALGLQGK
ncbi:glycogen synthase [Patescibacteria group bacterium]|nr:glycogen synthase [Patescibacteria group bacterium]